MNVADFFRLAEDEQVVVAAHLPVPGIEARAAIAILVEPERLDHGAHGAVEHQDALGREAAERGVVGSRRHHAASSHIRPQAEQMADRVDQVGAVHGVEVEVGDAAIDEIEHLLGGDRGGDELAGGGVVVEAVEALGQPVRHRRAAARGEILGLLEVLHRQDAGHDRHVDAARAHAVEIAEVEVVLEEELGDRAGGAGIDLGREHVEVGLHGRAVRMLFRIGGDRHLDIGEPLDAGDQIGAVAIAAGMRRISLADAADRIAAQRHDVAHARGAIVADHRHRSRRRSRPRR